MRILFLFLFALLTLAGCERTSAPATAPATQPAVPRIVSMVPAATLNLVLINAADTLVGVTKYDALFLPDAQKNIPIVGDYETMNLESLVNLHPTAVIVQFADARLPERLRDLAASDHFEILNLKLDTIEDLWPVTRELGRISNHQKDADDAIASAQHDLDQIAGEYKSRPRVKVVYLVDHNPLSAAGAKTFMDQMLTVAGGENLAAKVGDFYPVISKETLAKLAPDVLLISAPDEPAQQQNDPRLDPYMSLPVPAVKQKRVYLVTDGDSLIASVQIAKQVRGLADLLHQNEPLRLDFSPATKPAGGGAIK